MKTDPIQRLERRARSWTTQAIIAGALLSVAVAALSVRFLSGFLSAQHYAGKGASAIVHGIAYLFFVLTATIIAVSVVTAFRRDDRRRVLVTVVASYFSLMLIFASMYYEAAFFGDFTDAVAKYDRYRADALRHAPPRIYADRRAFFGVDRRFWSGVDWSGDDESFENGLPLWQPQYTASHMQRIAATQTIEETVRFVPSAQIAIFADCLHFSVITMTTVGYGDITPRSIAARIASDTEAICNTILLIFGLGMIFGNFRSVWRSPPEAP